MSDVRTKYTIETEDKSSNTLKNIAKNSNKANLGIQNLGGSLGKIAGSLTSVGIGMGALGITAAVTGLISMGKNAMDVGSKMNDLSMRLGVSTEFLSQMGYAIKQQGGNFESFTSGFKKMELTVSKGSSSFDKIGLSLKDLKSMSPEQQFMAISESLNKVKSTEDKLAIATSIFGKQAGADFVQLSEGGSSALLELMKVADKLNITISKEQAEAADAAGDAWDRLKSAGGGLAIQVGSILMPLFKGIADVLTLLTIAASSLVDVFVKWASVIGNVLKPAINWLGGALNTIFNVFTSGITVMLDGIAGWLELASKIPGIGDTLGEWSKDITNLQNKISNWNDKNTFTSIIGDGANWASAQLDKLNVKIDKTKLLNDISDSGDENKSSNAKINDYGMKDVYSYYDAPMQGPENDPMIEKFKALQKILENVKNSFGGVAKSAADLRTTSDMVVGEMTNMFGDFANSLVDSISWAVMQGDNLLETLSDVAKSLFSSLLSFGIKFGLSALTGGAGGFFAGAFGMDSMFKANGGPVNANQSYIVGERGPEIFTPRSAGTITPNNQIASGPPINVVVNANNSMFTDNQSMYKLSEKIADTIDRKIGRTYYNKPRMA